MTDLEQYKEIYRCQIIEMAKEQEDALLTTDIHHYDSQKAETGSCSYMIDYVAA